MHELDAPTHKNKPSNQGGYQHSHINKDANLGKINNNDENNTVKSTEFGKNATTNDAKEMNLNKITNACKEKIYSNHEIMKNQASAKTQSSKRITKLNILEILIAIAILITRIATDHLDISEYFDKAIELNVLALNDINKVLISDKISKEINENEREVPSANSSQNTTIEGDVSNINDKNTMPIKNIINSTFVGAMIFTQRKEAPSKLKHTKRNCKHIPKELWLKSQQNIK